MSTFSRRDLLRFGALSAGALGLPSAFGRAIQAQPGPRSQPDFSIAYLTDMHVHAGQGAPEGCARAVQRALAGDQRPELFIMGGDQPFDILRTDVAAADAQYDLYDQAIAGVDVPIHPVLGNHDVLGIYDASPLTPDHPKYGKAYFLDRFALPRTYYSFDHEEWHFVVLDSIGIEGNEYRGWIDAEQLAWLDDDLASSAKPTVVATHIPVFSNFIELRRGTSEGLPPGVSIVNSHEVAEVISRHPVRLVLGGHLHINETFLYKGTEYSNVGAVSGNWWDGEREGFQEGFARLDFVGDQVSWSYVDYGWEVGSAAQPDTEAAG